MPNACSSFTSTLNDSGVPGSGRFCDLSPVFSENLGDDILNVASQPFYSINGALDCPASLPLPTNAYALYWSEVIHLSTPFFYDPAKGNLLLDLTISAHKPGRFPDSSRYQVLLESELDPNDATASIVAGSTEAERAEVVRTGGLVTQFHCVPFPKLYLLKSPAFREEREW